jgi:DUF1680 family protein
MDPEQQVRCALRLRVPGWAKNVAVPGDLYKFTDVNDMDFSLRVNGRPAQYSEESGYLIVDRQWTAGDIVEFSLPMPIRTVVARSEVSADRDHMMLQRGPLVYCAEALDNGGNAWNLIMGAQAQFAAKVDRIGDERIIALRGKIDSLNPTGDGRGARTQAATLTAIPYYAWANRGCYDMQVWLPTRIRGLKIDA